MNCQDIEKLLLKPLDPAPEEGVKKHLKTCPACRTAWEKASALQGLLALKRYEKPAADTQDRCITGVLNELRDPTHAEPPIVFFTPVRLALAAGLAALLVGGLALLLMRPGHAPSLAGASTNQNTDLELPAGQMLERMTTSTNVNPSLIEYGNQPSRVADFTP